MGFFSQKKIRVLLFIFAVLFILSLGPLLRIDPLQRKTYLSALSKTPAHLIDGAEETIYLPKAGSTHQRNFSFAYIHGFSASRQEISPVVEDLADYFGAPVFFARLTGHGIDDEGASLSQGHCFDWLNDADRVIEKAKVPGRDLILIGTSFGGLMSTFAVLEHPQDIKGLILISPIFELPNPAARFFSGPLGGYLARLFLGSSHEFIPKNEMNRKYSTTRYSTQVLPQLMDCVNYMREQDFSKVKIPLLIFYTDKDEVVSLQAIKERFKDFGSTKKFLIDVPGADNHVLTGNIMNPGTVPFLEERIKEFLK